MSAPRFVRRAPIPQDERNRGKEVVRVGGVDLSARQAQFLIKYAERFNGTEAAQSVGLTHSTSAAMYASQTLRNANVKSALRGILLERRRRVERDADEVARYWWAVATADPRHLSNHIVVPCKHCWGEEHRYQETQVEQDERFVAYEAEQSKRDRMDPDKLKRYLEGYGELPPFERAAPSMDSKSAWVVREFGGAGYTTNKDPMRGPDWLAAMERMFAEMGAPLPEWVDENSDHSCPACHGHGRSHAVLADTRRLSPEAALLFDGVRETRQGIEIKTLDRLAAMGKYEALMGMSGPQRFLVAPDMEQLTDEQLAAELARRGVVIDGTFQDVTGKASPADDGGGPRELEGFLRPDLLRPRE